MSSVTSPVLTRVSICFRSWPRPCTGFIRSCGGPTEEIRQEREKCCDEMAVAHLDTPPEHYTGAIVDALAAERRSAHPIPSLAIVGSVRDIEERIKTMLRPGKTFRRRPSLVAATVALLIALVTIPTALVLTARGQAQPTAQSVDKPAAATASSAEPEQPRYAARTFNSKMAFDVVHSEDSSVSMGVDRTNAECHSLSKSLPVGVGGCNPRTSWKTGTCWPAR